MEYLDALHHGAKDGVAGSCRQSAARRSRPIDCGLFQGEETSAEGASGADPLIGRFTLVYRELKPFWGDKAQQRIRQGLLPLAFEQLQTVGSHQALEAMVRHLAQTVRPAIVIAANGMCSGGRIANYLKAMLHAPWHNLLFVGYQVLGRPGRAIQTYAARGGYVDLDGQRYEIGAKVHTIGGYSAHADRIGLRGFVVSMCQWPRQVRIVHGENTAKREFAERIRVHYRRAGRMRITSRFQADQGSKWAA